MWSKTIKFNFCGARYVLGEHDQRPEAGASEVKPGVAGKLLKSALRSSARSQLMGWIRRLNRSHVGDDERAIEGMLASLEAPLGGLQLYRSPRSSVSGTPPRQSIPPKSSSPEPLAEPEDELGSLTITVMKEATCTDSKKAVAEGAAVEISGAALTKRVVSDAQGRAVFGEVPVGSYVVEATLAGYQVGKYSLTVSGEIERDILLSRSGDWDITMIPEIMDAKEWDVGAELMRAWFENPSYTYPNPDNVDNDTKTPSRGDIVTLKWIKEFSRTKKIYDDMWDQKIYTNEAAKKEIEEVLGREGKIDHTRKVVSFGDLSQEVSKINRSPYYIQSRPHQESKLTDLDDLYAAVADLSFRMAVEGRVTYKGTKKVFWDMDGFEDVFEIRITKVGVYVRDSYDFIDGVTGQPLGSWNPTTNEVSKLGAGAGFHRVWNSTFRTWRDQSGCGGDYLVFSDLEVREVEEAWTISVDR